MRASCTWKAKVYWHAYVCAVLYWAIALLQGTEFFILYGGGLVVLVLIQEANDKRARKQVDLIVDLIREVEKKNRGDT